MEEEIDEPLVAEEVIVQTSTFMPLCVADLVDSTFTAISTGDEFKAGIILWCKAWHQKPAGSLPDDDLSLAWLAGYGKDVDAWRKVKDVALRHFKHCHKTKKLYHPKIIERALIAFQDRENMRAAGRAGAEKRWNKSKCDPRQAAFDLDGGANGEANSEASGEAIAAPIADPMGTGMASKAKLSESKLSESKQSKEAAQGAALCAASVGVWFAKFWNKYPHRIGKKKAQEAFVKVLKSGVTIDQMMAGLDVYIRTKPPDRPWCNPLTWLNQGRWEDQPAIGGNAKPDDASSIHELPSHGQRVTDAMCKLPQLKHHIGKVFLVYDSDEWRAWIYFYRDEAQKAGRPAPVVNAFFGSKDGKGWTFPGRWPPGHNSQKGQG